MIFTDLDGTLLDSLSYSFRPALPALDALKERSIPLVFCTSKTKAETEKIRNRTGNTHPFIVENGGAILIPKDYFPSSSKKTGPLTQKDARYQIIELGTSYARLRKVLAQIQARYPGKIRGFGDLSATAVATLCEFSSEEAVLAKQREYDEPFILDDESLIDKIQETAQLAHLQINLGGRFYHLTGDNDKGKAVLRLIAIYRENIETFQSIALGDSQNDQSMLAAVDMPILLPKPDGQYDTSVNVEGLLHAKEAGPKGWCDAVLTVIQDS